VGALPTGGNVRISDNGARWIGWVTSATALIAVIVFVGFVVMHEYPRREQGLTMVVTVSLVLFGAWAVAYVTMVVHQHQSAHVSTDDAAEWSGRQDSKMGALVPFIYLLVGRKQQRILTYLREKPAPKKRRRARS
jgi:hypothetical protein